MALNVTEQEALARLTRQLRESLGDRLIRVTLFGSKARNEGQPDSDVDVLVLVRNLNPQTREHIYDILLEIELTYESQIALKVFDKGL